MGQIEEAITSRVKMIFEHQKQSMGPFFEQISKMIMLNGIDQNWKEHLYAIDKVKEGINLRAYGQKDPLIEYKKEAFKAFEHLNNVIKTETIEKIMRVQLVAEGNQDIEQVMEKMRPEESDESELNYSAPSEQIESFSDMNADGPGGNSSTEMQNPARRRLVAGPPRQDERPQNRAERRRNKGR